MNEAGSLAVPLTVEERTEHLPEALNEIVYRLRYVAAAGSR